MSALQLKKYFVVRMQIPVKYFDLVSLHPGGVLWIINVTFNISPLRLRRPVPGAALSEVRTYCDPPNALISVLTAP
jgi:hypothetical protein